MTGRTGMVSGSMNNAERQARVRRFVARYTPQLVLGALIVIFFVVCLILAIYLYG